MNKTDQAFRRAAVYAAIDTERDYQDRRWGKVNEYRTESGSSDPTDEGGSHDGNRTLDEFCLYVAGYADDLKRDASHTADPAPKLDGLRKVAALCVAAMEQHGAPMRDDGAGNLGSLLP